MRTRLIQIGNSKGVRLSKSLIKQFELGEGIIIEPTDKGILISSAKVPRQGWEEKFKAAKTGDAADEWNDAQNQFDKNEWTW